jgi:hypothetical protein
MPNPPGYSYPPVIVLRLAGSILIGDRWSFRRDAIAFTKGIQPPVEILGSENIPLSGPCLITFNHYHRPGFSAWWMALALAACLPVEIHFVMTSELTYPGKWYSLPGRFVSRLLLKRIARIYGFTTTPPMPPRTQDVEARAQSVRRVLEYARNHPQAVIGLAPEGGDQPGGILSLPPAGSGRFISLLAKMGCQILPVGMYEERGRFCLNFGKACRLPAPGGKSPNEKDRQVARMIMQKIAVQLPERLRGDFSR